MLTWDRLEALRIYFESTLAFCQTTCFKYLSLANPFFTLFIPLLIPEQLAQFSHPSFVLPLRRSRYQAFSKPPFSWSLGWPHLSFASDYEDPPRGFLLEAFLPLRIDSSRNRGRPALSIFQHYWLYFKPHLWTFPGCSARVSSKFRLSSLSRRLFGLKTSRLRFALCQS